MKLFPKYLPSIGRIIIPAFCLYLVASVTSQAFAQQYRSPRYQPATPTISPYLNLLRQDTGPVPNYYSLVRPQLQQQAVNDQQQGFNQRQQQTNLLQQQEITAVNKGLVELRPAPIRATGTAGGFMNRSHYYPGSTNSGRR